MTFLPVDPELVRPSVDDVAKLERTRTVDMSGMEQATFNDQTRPTSDEVEDLIGQALDDVLARLPAAFDPALYGATRRLIALRVAMLTELSFYREASDGPAKVLADLFAGDLVALVARAHGGPILQASQGPPPVVP